MIQPWKLIKDGKPIEGLRGPIADGVEAYMAFVDSYRSDDPDEGLTVVPYDESTRYFLLAIQKAGGGFADVNELLAREVIERADVFTWGDIAVERMELRELS